MPSESKTSKRRSITAEREVKTFELRKSGWTFREIGAELGISGSAAYKLVNKVLRRHADLLKEDVPAQLAMELARLDAILRSIWPGVQDGDLQAVDRALKVGARRARLLGLDRKPSEEDPERHSFRANQSRFFQICGRELECFTFGGRGFRLY